MCVACSFVLFVVRCSLCVVCCVLFAMCCLLFVVCCSLLEVCCLVDCGGLFDVDGLLMCFGSL